MTLQSLYIIGLQWRLKRLQPFPVHPVAHHIQRIRPLDRFIPFLTGVCGIEVGVWHLTSLNPVGGELSYVAVTHQCLTKHLDAVFYIGIVSNGLLHAWYYWEST